MKKNNTTEMVFILDRSGSMYGLEKDTIGGFNSMLGKQKNQDGEAFVTTVLFDHEYKIVHDRLAVNEVPEMTANDYQVRGSTALIDAIGKTIRHIANIHKYARKEDVPENTVFVIITDGMENASREFTSDKVKTMVEHEKQKYGWEFIFLGANIDAVKTAKHFGIESNRAVNYNSDSQGTAINYEVVSDAVSCCRMSMPLSEDWSRRIDDDYKKRKTN
ncbi:MAG: VWA domain-containing protein [Clostridia bacterium]|nr:VWA domain-containing protein [Clostridia bacterium]